MKQPKQLPTKYQIIDRMLYNLGMDIIDKERFWREMTDYGYTQADIDWWCEQYYAANPPSK